MATFINFSNHPSRNWGKEQLEAARKLGGEVIDLSFPAVPATATPEMVEAMADEAVANIVKNSPAAVMAQGEFALTFAVVARLKTQGIPCVVACSERKVAESVDPTGATVKTATFEFIQFREV